MNNIILGDWGTSNLRLYLYDGQNIIDKINGNGIKNVKGNIADYLMELSRAWIDKYDIKSIYLCGTVGSRLGLVQTPYVKAPADAASFFSNHYSAVIDNINIHITYGLCAPNFFDKSDIMRGEETQVFGVIDPEIAQEKLYLLPGSHCKWVIAHKGQIIKFHSYATGEIFEAISLNTSLLAKDKTVPLVQEDDDGFLEALSDATLNPGFSKNLFRARIGEVLENKPPTWSLSYLSGILIHDEIYENLKLLKSFNSVKLIGQRKLCLLYQAVLKSFGIDNIIISGDIASANGLIKFYHTGKSHD
jgi:2-dehydro-3-deoxygalactonokinase